MADKTYTVTVASGDLYLGGTGNVYYLDGVRNSTGPGTINWVSGASLKFEQSDASNNNHPLIFSTTTSRDQYLTSGVTYYLDGASNYAAYTNTGTFNAATTRYIEITPSSQTDFYYLCYVHGIGMGGIFDITQSTWGALSWSNGNWGAQNNIDISQTGLSSSLSQGSTTASGDINEGWGGETWGENNWGEITEQVATITGISMQSSVGDVGFAGATEGWGRPAWGTDGWGIVGDVLAQGQQLTLANNQVSVTTTIEEGWGRFTWGNQAWGEPFAAAATGQSLTTSQGTAVGFTDFNIVETGQALGLTLAANFSIQIDNNVFVNASEATINTTAGAIAGAETNANVPVTGSSATTSVGQVVPEPRIEVDVTGIQASLSLGTAQLVQTTTEIVTGQAATLTQGSAQQASVYPVTTAGLLSSSIGSVTQTTTANVPLTGIGLTASIGTVKITAWSEINPGVNNTWSEVDLAA
jgi:hypothetical protein